MPVNKAYHFCTVNRDKNDKGLNVVIYFVMYFKLVFGPT